jgi:hypothetical protein
VEGGQHRAQDGQHRAQDGRHRAQDGPGPAPGPAHVVGWVVSAVREATYAPATIAAARRLLARTHDVPDQLERVVVAVEQTTAPLSASLEDVAAALTEIRDRLEHLDTVIGHLRDTLVGVIAAVPGARRALDRLPPPPPPAVRGDARR